MKASGLMRPINNCWWFSSPPQKRYCRAQKPQKDMISLPGQQSSAGGRLLPELDTSKTGMPSSSCSGLAGSSRSSQRQRCVKTLPLDCTMTRPPCAKRARCSPVLQGFFVFRVFLETVRLSRRRWPPRSVGLSSLVSSGRRRAAWTRVRRRVECTTTSSTSSSSSSSSSESSSDRVRRDSRNKSEVLASSHSATSFILHGPSKTERSSSSYRSCSRAQT
mmetsp:Transcript_3465/g.10618  ORF Transcript_3465/g.10618 Transcript_3465/m.10618 type:complete len:219 (+) Transcript_3465:335-991(+)